MKDKLTFRRKREVKLRYPGEIKMCVRDNRSEKAGVGVSEGGVGEMVITEVA